MQTITILDIKPFMQFLFGANALEQYHFISADIRTDMTYSLDGHINRSFFSEEELAVFSPEEGGYLPWKLAKEKVFTLIKGKKIPSLLKIVLKASASDTHTFLTHTNSSLNSKDIDGMFLNIFFQENHLQVVCGISYRIFTMDKDLEAEFAENIITLFKSNGITCS
ncbi:MAG: DUF5721 family protein [Bacteroidales bacterium]|nr:DUF5721 family protein [Clostridium sp.]MCM1203192.1 DUF5721 family protein [Bacteroidales bacterium]